VLARRDVEFRPHALAAAVLSDAPTTRQRRHGRKTSAGHDVFVWTLGGDDGCAIVAVAYFEAKRAVAERDRERDRFPPMHDRVRNEFRSDHQRGLLRLTVKAVCVQ
jgi:hypothetical protein